MKERPILFNTENVKAILEGRKTQTRRVIKPQPEIWRGKEIYFSYPGHYKLLNTEEHISHYCKYGKRGDRLWARETWYYDDSLGRVFYKANQNEEGIIFRNDPDFGLQPYKIEKWKPSIFMPKKFSRITLEIVDLRVEQLQNISELDAHLEGIERSADSSGYTWYKNYLDEYPSNFKQNPIKSFKSLWDSINKKRGYSWDSNPWVYVIEFKKI